jgi:2-dehydro-3-deoxy-D-arabinonate dehydratase
VSALVRVRHRGTVSWAVERGTGLHRLDHTLADLLAMPLAQARAAYQAAGAPLPGTEVTYLPPVDDQEVWAAGVTYERSRAGRAEESGHAALYDQVYDAERPELFFKSTPDRVVGPGEPVGIRADSPWNVPEPEVGLVITGDGEIFGYLVGNDMSSRSIEGENPLYLPQAKVYTRSCALGARVVPAWERGDDPLRVAIRITRAGDPVFTAATSTASMRRTFPDLVDWLLRALDCPHGVVLLTGTGLVPPADFTLAPGDTIDIEVDGVDTLTNPVTVVGR